MTFSRLYAFFIAAMCLAAGAIAADAGPDLWARSPYEHISYIINPDGSYIEKRSWAMTVLKEQALTSLKSQSVTYSTSIQRAEVLEAYTLKTNGRRIDAPKSNYQIEEHRGKNTDAPVFSDLTTLTVVFPDVEVGDTVAFSYRLIASEPTFPGQFSTFEEFSKYNAYDDVSVTFDYPAAMAVRYRARQMTESAPGEKNGRRIVQWTYQNRNPATNKRAGYAVYDPEKNPGVAFSTFKDYSEITEAYGKRARAKAIATERATKLANDITATETARREIARRLYDWVATHITYAGNCIGLGAVVPHDLDFILDNRMGDCKDHATLLQALLTAKGIASTQVLINAGRTYTLPEVPVVAMVNHVINYLPELDLYLDSTSSSTPFGLLPYSDSDKPVLWVDNYRSGARTPPVSAEANQQVMKTVVKIHSDGSASGHVDVQLKGMLAANARDRFRGVSKEAEADIVKNVFRSSGLDGEGIFTKDDPKELLDTFQFGANFEVKDWVVVPGPGAFSIQPLFFSEAPISSYMAAAVMDIDGDEEAVCAGGRSAEEYVYEFPAGMKILAAPDNFKFDSGAHSYTATYALKNNTLTVRRLMDDRTPGNVCSRADLIANKNFAQKIKPNFRSQVVYK